MPRILKKTDFLKEKEKLLMVIFIKYYIQHNNMKLNVQINKTRH